MVEVAKVEEPVTTKVLVTVLFVAVRLVATAFVVVELPTTRSVKLASVATREEKKPLVEVALSAVRFVMVALVVVELPMMRSVIDASVATREEMKELVEVLLEEEALIVAKLSAERLRAVAFTAFKFVLKKLEEVALVTIEDDAKIFSANKFRNLLTAVPSE